MKRTIVLTSIVLGIAALVHAQIKADVGKGGEKPTIAVPDFRGSGDAQKQQSVSGRHAGERK